MANAVRQSLTPLAMYCDRVIEVGLPPVDDTLATSGAYCPYPSPESVASLDEMPDLRGAGAARVLVLLYRVPGNLSQLEAHMDQLHPRLPRSARVAIVVHDTSGEAQEFDPPRTVGEAGRYDIVYRRRIQGRDGGAEVRLLRPIVLSADQPSLSIIVPARNERGNIEGLFGRLPRFDGCEVEILFVEGNSTDGTWEEIRRVTRKFSDQWTIKTLRQSGRGKADAVRLGIEAAEGDVVAILDADLTMPPEFLPEFYDAYVLGRGDFINGNRMLYPMEPGAMRPLNRLGNRAFARLVSWVLEVKLGDCLCGTKLFSRYDYTRFVRWREDFGDLDPFGDFELLFPAAQLGLGIVDVAVPYRARTYGATNIHRIRDGLRLLRMCLRGVQRIKWCSTNGQPAHSDRE